MTVKFVRCELFHRFQSELRIRRGYRFDSLVSFPDDKLQNCTRYVRREFVNYRIRLGSFVVLRIVT